MDETWTYAPAAEGTWNSYEGIVAANAENKTYDSHYLVGNYYQLNTATAGTGGTIYGGVAPSSICPKGWALPTYQQAGEQLASYGITNRITGTVDGVAYDILFGMSQIIQANNYFPRFTGMQVRCVAR